MENFVLNTNILYYSINISIGEGITVYTSKKWHENKNRKYLLRHL